MSRRAVLWVAFVIVHLGVAALGYLMPNEPMGDIYRVYEPWSGCALVADAAHCTLSSGWSLPGITTTWVYPQLALIPMLVPWLFAWAITYTPAWALVVILADAGAFAMLVGRGRSDGRVIAAWFWLAFIALLGPIGLYRLDGFTVPLVLAGSLWLIPRPFIASILLAAAAWMKVWPAAIIAAAVIAARRRLTILGGAVTVSAVTLGTVAALGGGAYAFGFIADQADRGLQIEAPVSMLFVWQAVTERADSFVYYDTDMLTYQVTGPGIDPVIAVMTPLLVLAVAGVAAIGAAKAWRRASFSRLFPPLALALVLAFIVFNKVGSPQYIGWLVPPLAVGLVLDRRRWSMPAALGLSIALLTQLVYPIAYGGLTMTYPLVLPTLLLTIRNVAVIVLFAWMLSRLIAVPPRPGTASTRGTRADPRIGAAPAN